MKRLGLIYFFHPSLTLSLPASPSYLSFPLSSHPSTLSLSSVPCCTTAPQSGSWATCSRISSTSRFFPGGSTSFVILCWRVRGKAISWINWPSGLLSTCRYTRIIKQVHTVHTYICMWATPFKLWFLQAGRGRL